MMKCPACGAPNSVKRTTCFQCEAALHEGASAAVTSELRVCKNCAHATIHPPAGTTVRAVEVWCLKQKAARSANYPAGDCFESSFTWKREESLD